MTRLRNKLQAGYFGAASHASMKHPVTHEMATGLSPESPCGGCVAVHWNQKLLARRQVNIQ